MKYPTLNHSRAKVLVEQLIADASYTPNFQLELRWVEIQENLNLEPVEASVAEMKEFFGIREEGVDAEAVEGKFCGAVHKAMRDIPIVALDDPGFWRYLSLAHFWWFIAEREAKAVKNGNAMTYVDGGQECVPLRMFLRGQAIRDGDDYSLAGAIPKSTDFWRSHILRVKTGTAPPLAREFARLQKENRMVSDDVRPFAKKLNRVWTNVVLNVWNEDESQELLNQLYEEHVD